MNRGLSRYGPVMAELLCQTRLMPLGAGKPNLSARAMLGAMTVERVFEGREVVDGDMARATLAGVWLYHDFFDESHEISQGIETPTGSYWHAILHRREPDYSNAGYWFRRVGRHPVFDSLGGEASKIGAGVRWDPFRFIEVCEKAANEGGELERVCREVQRVEWRELLDFTYTRAIGA